MSKPKQDLFEISMDLKLMAQDIESKHMRIRHTITDLMRSLCMAYDTFMPETGPEPGKRSLPLAVQFAMEDMAEVGMTLSAPSFYKELRKNWDTSTVENVMDVLMPPSLNQPKEEADENPERV